MSETIVVSIFHNGKYEEFTVDSKPGVFDKINDNIKNAIISDPDTVDGIFIYKNQEDPAEVIIIPPNILKNSIIKVKKLNSN